jgi:Caspase domain
LIAAPDLTTVGVFMRLASLGSTMNCRALLLRLVALCALALSAQNGHAEKRALVVGTNAYDNLGSLDTAVNDAKAIGETLRAAGFSVVPLTDATRAKFGEKWREFLSSLQQEDLAIVHFAGHGIQVDGALYLLLKDTPGVDAGESKLLEGSINFYEAVQQVLERRPAKSIFIVDACRESPFSKKATARFGQQRGMALLEVIQGTFLLYSAGPGETALDGLTPKATNSVYTSRLVPLLKIKDLGLNAIATRVRVQVEEDARSVDHQQVPAYIDGIRGGQYYWDRLESSEKAPGPDARITSSTVIRLQGFASWDSNCQSRPAPRITTVTRPKFGKVLTRFESFTAGETQVGTVACRNTPQKGIAVYYVIDDAYRDSTAVDSVQFTVKHWSISPSVSVTETYNVDLAAKLSTRITGR